ncbi:PASTA domain-containing protein [Thermodesulfobacteriota bacterium]
MFLRIFKIGAVFVVFALAAGASAYLALTLFIKSEDTVVVPNLTGKDVVYALEILTDLGLNTKVKGSEYSAAIPKNQVIFQAPDPGTEMKKGRDVKIILSKGPQYVAMPNLRGLSVQQARILLEENGLCRGELSSLYSDVLQPDEIIAQTPLPGTMITRGTCVDILESSGDRPEMFAMLDLRELSIDEAILRIEANNLLLGKIKTDQNPKKRPNTILAQEPSAGHRVATGSVIDLIVNKAAGTNAPAGVEASNRIGFFRYRVSNGFLKQHIRVRMDSLGVSSELFNKLVRPGEEIWLLIPKQDRATVFLYADDSLVKTQIY